MAVLRGRAYYVVDLDSELGSQWDYVKNCLAYSRESRKWYEWVSNTWAEVPGGEPGPEGPEGPQGPAGATFYTLHVQALTSAPADGQTIYFGTLPKAPVTAAATSKVQIPRSGTLRAARIYCYAGTAGTNEAWSLYIRLNNTTDTLVATVSAATNERIFSNLSLGIAVTTNDYIEMKAVNPTWVTNPNTTIWGGHLLIEG